jgi:AraC-like DNA-binding protein/quercetin dioxygenase-like cupin family protein
MDGKSNMRNSQTEKEGNPFHPEVVSVGISVWDPVWAIQDHVGTYTELVHIIRGDVTLFAGGDRYRGRAGDTLVVPARTRHRDAFTPGSVFEVLHVSFTWPQQLPRIDHRINGFLTRLQPAQKQTLKELLADVHDDFRRPIGIAQQMTGVSLYRGLLFLLAAVKEFRKPHTSDTEDAGRHRRQQLVRRAKDFIGQNLGRPVTLSSIAEHLGISSFHLSHIFSQEGGFTLSAYLLHERMRKASELLADPSRRISQAGYAAGFEDPNYFGKAFRKYFGETPGSFRARIIGGDRNKTP